MRGLATASLPTATILGSRVHGPTLDEASRIVAQWIARRDGRCRHLAVTGFHGLWVGHREPDFQEILNAADLFCPDGIAPILLSRLSGRPLPQRVPGPDIMQKMLEIAQATGYRSYFYGDTETTLAALRERLRTNFPGAPVAGCISPPFRPLSAAEEAAHIDAINASGADILWVGLGCPKQERWIARNRARLTVPVAIGVGAAFRFHAGLARRAPRWLGEAGFEWLWRLAMEPKKVARRDFSDGPRFLVAALSEAVRLRYGDKDAAR
ncbi:WecB/TagA/CpsF family glycosyltransferase [Jiella sp. MQZ9-1]|uniref:WecB/TagA/CpsF family glycosyltransferase n=1 Tax=Jiella flava TaxID=2816857 RepID=A0A939JVX7_9HYPH|nr:WecB/TagA/CpsF family glycosyltransferase [Jiella flava]MBO0662452.1 WecB/TagA/CpsF family glycosyltransferase [Jiella flava]MCD2471677.1 WecB/TagA/CpsF family glycosyltransferase [Jiella flava]